MVFEAASTVIIRKHPEVNGETAVNEAGATEVAGNAGVATPRRPADEEMPRCLQTGLPRCPDCQDDHTQRLEKLCHEAKELRMKHELLLARCVKNNLKGVKGVM
jgi:hypothetical protein